MWGVGDVNSVSIVTPSPANTVQNAENHGAFRNRDARYSGQCVPGAVIAGIHVSSHETGHLTRWGEHSVRPIVRKFYFNGLVEARVGGVTSYR